MKLYLLRHGKTSSNDQHAYNASNDESVSSEGLEELKALRPLYEDVQFDYVYCSKLKRCQESIKELFPGLKIDEIRDDIVEMNFGDWVGRTYQSVIEEYAKQGFTYDDLIDPPNGESYASLFKRTGDFINEVTTKHPNDTVMVMSHGLVISAIMKQFYLKDEPIYFLAPDNGKGYIIDIDKDNIKVKKI